MTLRTLLPLAASAAVMLAASCNSSGPQPRSLSLREKVDSLEAVFFDKEKTSADPETGMRLIKAYAHYYSDHKGDSLAIDMLFKAGEVSMGIGNGMLAVRYFGMLAEEHPEFHKVAEARFLMGFSEDNLNGNLEQARFYYEDFLSRHPDHPLAKDAQFSLQHLGKSDEELIRMFQEQAAKEKAAS